MCRKRGGGREVTGRLGKGREGGGKEEGEKENMVTGETRASGGGCGRGRGLRVKGVNREQGLGN